ncbi:DUF3168 domain-containing protein [Amycolatopsis halotolerans]|uniref:DUF3168 domain-containing protein n=1 Tax=Amycolatopsis halotolerans TaxID=330083 RepID=A0ABV7QXX3_9PSEU
MILEHHDAIRALLAPLPFYDGQVPPKPTYPYRVVYFDTGTETATKLEGSSDRAEFRFQITSVAESPTGVAIVADAARKKLIDVAPAVPGRVCTRIDHETAIPVRAQEEVTNPNTDLHPMYAVDTYHFSSFAD